MTDESNVAGFPSGAAAGQAPDLAGVYGRIRLEVGGVAVGTLVIEGTHVELTQEARAPSDATVLLDSMKHLRELLAGRLNPFIASMRGWALAKGDRQLVTRVAMGLRAGSPFSATDRGEG